MSRKGRAYIVLLLTSLQGKIDGHTMIVTDSFALPIPAGMDRGAAHVNPGQEAMEYMVQYTELIKDVGKRENVVGWYHSHPGYGCWLSGVFDIARPSKNVCHLPLNSRTNIEAVLRLVALFGMKNHVKVTQSKSMLITPEVEDYNLMNHNIV